MTLSLVDSFDEFEIDDLDDEMELVDLEHDDFDFFLYSLHLISFY